MRVATLPEVIMSTNVISVGENTLGRNASLQQLGTMGSQQLNLILNSPPVTPVRVSVLKSLLSTYDPNLKIILINGFSLGFSLGFTGTSKLLLVPKFAPQGRTT